MATNYEGLRGTRALQRYGIIPALAPELPTLDLDRLQVVESIPLPSSVPSVEAIMARDSDQVAPGWYTATDEREV